MAFFDLDGSASRRLTAKAPKCHAGRMNDSAKEERS
jgi:hypothetical protein